MITWRQIGIAGAVSSWVLLGVIQAVSGDFLPPEISVSQYGVGPHGWLFTFWTGSVALTSAALYLAAPVRRYAAPWWVGIGVVSLLVMGVIRTDSDGLGRSWHAKVHLAGAIGTLIALPVGMALVMSAAARAWSRVTILLASVAAFSLLMLVLAGLGFDTAGLGPNASWAFWQSVAIIADLGILVCWASAIRTVNQVAAAHAGASKAIL